MLKASFLSTFDIKDTAFAIFKLLSSFIDNFSLFTSCLLQEKKKNKTAADNVVKIVLFIKKVYVIKNEDTHLNNNKNIKL